MLILRGVIFVTVVIRCFWTDPVFESACDCCTYLLKHIIFSNIHQQLMGSRDEILYMSQMMKHGCKNDCALKMIGNQTIFKENAFSAECFIGIDSSMAMVRRCQPSNLPRMNTSPKTNGWIPKMMGWNM